ncbi:MAG: OsmC family protein [Anaerolineales bacterium]|nr:OsmC family protein [Anaerolineales bacterium]
MENLKSNQKKEKISGTVSGSVWLNWIGSQMMTGFDSRGTPLVIGRWPERDPESIGLKASDLLLLAAAACSSYDIITILTKQREPLESLEVTCTGDQEKEPPFKFVRIHLHYRLKGSINAEKVERAIELSEEKYCSVTNTLKGNVEISSDYEIM